MKLSDTQLNQLRLFRAHGVGPVIYNKLMHRFGSAEEALKQFEHLNKTYNKRLSPCSEKQIQAEIKALESSGGALIFMEDAAFPTPLKFIDDCPPVISVLGNVSALNKEHIAMVGNRNASAPAMKFTAKLSAELCEIGMGVISGLARGIDTAAHQGALTAKGTTIAVLAGGVNHIYPPENKKLYEDIIAQGGAIISEMPWGTVPTQNHFPRRNRIVSGMSLGVAVIECAKRSGSLITARLALEQNREVFAMPGSPADPRAEGPNHLIRGGAHMLTCVNDILDNRTKWMETTLEPHLHKSQYKLELAETIRSLEPSPKEEPSVDDVLLETDVKNNDNNDPRMMILALLSPSQGVDTDTLLRAINLPEAETSALLAEMELDGDIERSPSGYIKA